MMPHTGSAVAPSRLSAPYRRSKATAMACPVKAVEMTASAMMAGTNVAARFGPNEPKGQQRQADEQRDRDEHRQQKLFTVA